MIAAKKLMREQYKSNADLSRATGLDASTLSKILNGRIRPYPVQAKKIALALGYEGIIDELFREVFDD